MRKPARAVLEREDLMGTATGYGIAVPHARIPGLRRAVWTFGRSVSGVDWDAPDGRRVRLVFLILTPEEEAGLQLQMLSALAPGPARRPGPRETPTRRDLRSGLRGPGGGAAPGAIGERKRRGIGRDLTEAGSSARLALRTLQGTGFRSSLEDPPRYRRGHTRLSDDPARHC